MSLKFKKSSGFILITWYFFQFIPLYLSLIVTQALAFLKTDAAQICMCMYKYNVIQYNMKFVLSFSFFVFFFFQVNDLFSNGTQSFGVHGTLNPIHFSHKSKA